MKKTLRIKLGAVHVTVQRDSVTKLLYLFRNLSAIRKIRLLLPILSNIYSNPISSFLSISTKPKSANESGTTGGKFCFIYLSSVSYLTVISFLMFEKLSLTDFNLKEKNKDVQKNVSIFGSPSWTRTNDTAVNSRVLYRLSYGGILKPTKQSLIGYLCRHRPIFPGRFQPSIFGTNELNYRVRNGNGWTLIVINTD